MSEGNQKCRKKDPHGTYARRRTAKHYEFDGETINEGENGHPFFWCINTA